MSDVKKGNPKVDAYFAKAKDRVDEMKILRAICLETGLEEDLKWGKPAYMIDGKNVVLIQGFKAYCALLFVKGFAMKDPENKLIQIGVNTQNARQLRYDTPEEVEKDAAMIKAYIQEAITLEEIGVAIEQHVIQKAERPLELENIFQAQPEVQKAFDALTPGRQRAYLIHFTGAKQSKTITARIEKVIPQILAGKGMNE